MLSGSTKPRSMALHSVRAVSCGWLAVDHDEIAEAEHHAQAGRRAAGASTVSSGRRRSSSAISPATSLGISRASIWAKIPLPPARARVVPDQLLIVEEAEELADGERVASGPGVDELAELQRAAGVHAGGLADHARHFLGPERREVDLVDRRARGAQLAERDGQRMGGGDLGVAKGAHGQQVAAVRIARERLQQRERGDVRPLQIIQEEHQGVLGGGEGLQRLGEHAVEAVAGLGGGQGRGRRLIAEQRPGLRHRLDEHGGVHPERLIQPLARLLRLRLALGERLADELPQGLVDGVEGHAA